MIDTTHKIYINRAHVFDEGVTWTTVAGLYPHAYVPEDAFTSLRAERDAWKARAEAAEAALTCAWERGRDDAVKPNGLTYKPTDVLIAERHMVRQDIRALTPPADLAKGVADE